MAAITCSWSGEVLPRPRPHRTHLTDFGQFSYVQTKHCHLVGVPCPPLGVVVPRLILLDGDVCVGGGLVSLLSLALASFLFLSL